MNLIVLDLRRIPSEFLQSVSDPVIKGLLVELHDHDVFSDEENKSVIQDQTNTTDRARCLLETVIGKGENPSRIMIDSMKKRDRHFCITLGLISSDCVVEL